LPAISAAEAPQGHIAATIIAITTNQRVRIVIALLLVFESSLRMNCLPVEILQLIFSQPPCHAVKKIRVCRNLYHVSEGVFERMGIFRQVGLGWIVMEIKRAKDEAIRRPGISPVRCDVSADHAAELLSLIQRFQ
jgi:hypothetical protein